MCITKIKQILFPTNVTGRDIQTFSLPQVHPPYNDYNYNITWTGERLDVCYTTIGKVMGGRTVITPREFQYTNGNESEENISVRQQQGRSWASDIYFKCTNVTKLIINGEQYI